MKFAAMIIAAIVSLAGCSSEDTSSDNEAHAAAVIDKAAGSGDVNATRGLPVDDQAVLKPGALPPAFEGRWGRTPADCDIARSDTTGRLAIIGDTMTLYDASATAKAIGGPSRYKVVADLSFSDRGRTWRGRETLELTAAGTVLMRTTAAPAKTYRYDRC